MTIAKNPSAWYSSLQTYKAAQFRENAFTVASIAYQWLKTHRERIGSLLGGEPDFATIVPSKRPGVTYETQPLTNALRLVKPLADRLRHTLQCDRGNLGGHVKYSPEMFTPVDASEIRGSRIILIEDTWISGATAVSAANALLAAGAASIVVTPIARDFSALFHTENHTYAAYLAAPYEFRWPRS